jgi:hypothetical protein
MFPPKFLLNYASLTLCDTLNNTSPNETSQYDASQYTEQFIPSCLIMLVKMSPNFQGHYVQRFQIAKTLIISISDLSTALLGGVDIIWDKLGRASCYRDPRTSYGT